EQEDLPRRRATDREEAGSEAARVADPGRQEPRLRRQQGPPAERRGPQVRAPRLRASQRPPQQWPDETANRRERTRQQALPESVTREERHDQPGSAEYPDEDRRAEAHIACAGMPARNLGAGESDQCEREEVEPAAIKQHPCRRRRADAPALQ